MAPSRVYFLPFRRFCSPTKERISRSLSVGIVLICVSLVCQVNFTAIFYHKRASLASILLDLLISWFWVLLRSMGYLETCGNTLVQPSRMVLGKGVFRRPEGVNG